VEFLAQRPTPNLEDRWAVISLAITLWPVGLGDPARSLRFRQHSSRGHQRSQASPPAKCA